MTNHTTTPPLTAETRTFDTFVCGTATARHIDFTRYVPAGRTPHSTLSLHNVVSVVQVDPQTITVTLGNGETVQIDLFPAQDIIL